MPLTARQAHALCFLVVVLAATVLLSAKVKVHVQRDEAFKFTGVRTWAWAADGAGDVKMALTPNDDPAAVKSRLDPVILDAVGRGFTERGLTAPAAGAAPDLVLRYYVLISTNMSAQTIGQFAPAGYWGLPTFSGATQSLRVFEQGSLVPDAAASTTKELVWRGVAQAEIDRDRTPAERDKRLRAAIADLLKKFPKVS
jgi:Domain of unknown function (DUF4136)